MVRRRSFFLRALLALIILGGFVAIAAFSYRAGAARGYARGVATTDVEEDSLPLDPAHPFFAPPIARHAALPHFPLLGSFFCCGGALFLIVLAAVCRPPFWYHTPMMWHKHPRWHGHHHPWSECKESPTEEVAKTEDKADEASAR